MTIEERQLWESIFAMTRDLVAVHNGRTNQLTFKRFAEGFQIMRESPYLMVQRWVDVNGAICGSIETKNAKGELLNSLGPSFPLKDIDGNLATIDDVASRALKPFLNSSETG
jgi:hypothetical protein